MPRPVRHRVVTGCSDLSEQLDCLVQEADLTGLFKCRSQLQGAVGRSVRRGHDALGLVLRGRVEESRTGRSNGAQGATMAQPGQGGNVVDRRMALAREWDELVEQVRHLDGFANFLKPPKQESLLPAAARGPVAIINVSRWRCDALLVQPTGVTALPLAALTLDDIIDRANDYLEVLRAAE